MNCLELLRRGPGDAPGREEALRLLRRCGIGILFWGLLAHAYGFLHDSFSHDMLNALYADGVEVYWKMQLGRFGTVLYRRLVRVPLALPWLLGLLSLAWMALALFCIARLLKLRSRAALFFTAGLLAVNLSTIAMTATYLYEMDMDMLALCGAAAAALLWAEGGWVGALLGAVLLAGVLSLYQSFLSVAIVLVLLCCLRRLWEGEGFWGVFLSGLRSLVMFALGGGLYYALLRLMIRLKNIPLDTNTDNSVYQIFTRESGASGLWETLRAVYDQVGAAFFDPARSHLSREAVVCNALLLALSLLLLLVFLLRRGGWAEKLLALALLLLLPLGANVSCLFSSGAAHDLMKYAFWLLWLLPLLLLESVPLPRGEKAARALAGLAALVLLWGNVQTANALYVKKDLEQDATLSLMTRVFARIEAEPDYVAGETPLVFVGTQAVLHNSVYGFAAYSDITGAEAPSAIPYSNASYYYNAYAAYCRYVLNVRVAVPGFYTWQGLQYDERVAAMPAYPAAGCIQTLDGVWVVKLG